MKAFLQLFLFLVTATTVAQEWRTDLAQAKKEAAQLKRPIVLVFQGSDWCAPCIKLEREIWGSEEFKMYSSSHFVMLKADFPRKTKNKPSPAQQEKNNALAERYNKKGIFPYVVILDSEGKVLGTTGYKKMTPSAYISHLESFRHQ
tara:strand:+ start:87535 stop:87972 length:438 start_codon:yes stop_codon:yes gene_type:complete